MGASEIGAEHVLLGILAEGGGMGARLLADLGASLPQAREAVVELTVRDADEWYQPREH